MTPVIHHALVTGTDRPEGRAIAEALARDPRFGSVLCADEVEAGSKARPLPGVEHVTVGLTRERELRSLLFGERARRIDVVVHSPRLAMAGGYGRAPAPIVRSTELLLRLAEEHPSITRFVFMSSVHVYRIDRHEPMLIDEDHPLELATDAPASMQHLVQADLITCARIGVSRLAIAVLRCAEILGEGGSGRLQDYLSSRVCLRPLGFDPMLNVLSLADAANAVRLAALVPERGVFNIPGLDTLPLSELTHVAGRIGLPLPGPVLAPLYQLRALTTAFHFRYAPDRKLFHYGAILDGRRAERAFGYVPRTRAVEGDHEQLEGN